MTTSPGLPWNNKKALEVSLCLSDHRCCWHHVCSHGNMTIHTGMITSTQRWQQTKLDRYDPYLRQDSLLWLDLLNWGGKILAQSSIFESSEGSVDFLCLFLQWASLEILRSNRVIIFMSLLEMRCCFNHLWGFWGHTDTQLFDWDVLCLN